MIIGSHVSIRNGYLGAAKQAMRIGAKAFQYFPKNPRSLALKSFDQGEARACATYCQQHGLVSIAHSPYPTKLCPVSSTSRQEIIGSLLNDLDIANHCGSIGVVVHFGKYKGQNQLEGYTLMIDVLNDILERWEGESLLLLENNAGEGVKMGITLEEMVRVRELCAYPERIGFCFDTCHAFASGLWNGRNLAQLVRKGKELKYFEHLKAVHLNDSVYRAQSYRDRHANIGFGEIGPEHFSHFLQLPELQQIPLILETPYSKDYSHEDEIKYIERLIDQYPLDRSISNLSDQ